MRGLREQLKANGDARQLQSAEIRCYQPSATLFIHPLKGKRWLLPWSRFVSACYDSDELVLVFADLEVVIRGDRLTQLEPAIADCTLRVLRELPSEYRVRTVARPFITHLTVRDRRAGPDRGSEGNKNAPNT